MDRLLHTALAHDPAVQEPSWDVSFRVADQGEAKFVVGIVPTRTLSMNMFLRFRRRLPAARRDGGDITRYATLFRGEAFACGRRSR